MKKHVLLLTACLCTQLALAVDKLNFPKAGFSIAPLDSESEPVQQQKLVMFLPVSNGFAPNVNVMTQPHTGTLDEYIEISKQGFLKAGFTVLNLTKSGADTVIFEYTGQIQARSLHWYARAILKNGKIHLVSATALEEQWLATAAKLKACVDSFQLN
jgi:hypothetical protein